MGISVEWPTHPPLEEGGGVSSVVSEQAVYTNLRLKEI